MDRMLLPVFSLREASRLHVPGFEKRSETPVVFVVDADVQVRRALASLIRAQGWLPVTFARGGEFLAQPRVAAPCCLLLGVSLPDHNGLELQQRVADRGDMPIIFITGQTDVPTTVRAMKAGALEYLTKPIRDEVVLCAISVALEHSRAFRNIEVAKCALRGRYASLSRRERQVIELVTSGWLNKQIGAALGISEITVKSYRSKLMRKMNAMSLADLVRMATTLGLRATPRPNGLLSRTFATHALAPQPVERPAGF